MSLSPGPPPVSILPSSSPHTHIRSPITLITHERPTPTTGVSNANGPSQQAPGNPMASAALYLYTFLATLILLVGISLFIVIRSIVRRRRRNRAVHEAWLRYTNGSIPFREGDLDLIRFVEFRMNQAGFTPRSGRIDLSKVPRMWEVNISPKKSIVSEKTAEGKIISSSWKSNQLSNPLLDLESSLSPSWIWSSILPLSSAPLLDQTPASNEDGTTPGSAAMPVNPNGRRDTPLTGVRRFWGRILHGSAPSPGRGVSDQSRPNAPASASESPSETGNNPNANPIESVDGTAPPSSRSEDRNCNRTGTDIQLEEGSFHVHGSSGSNSVSNSQPQPYNSNTTNPSINQMSPTTITSTTIEMAESSSTYQQPGQRVGEVHVSHRIPSNPHPRRNSNQPPNHPLTPNADQEQEIPSGPGTDIDVNETRMRVAVLVRMPTPPTTPTSTPLSHSGLSKAKLKAKAKVESGYELKDEKRLSSLKTSVSTLGGGENKNDMDADGVQVQVPSLEVGLADVDVFPDRRGGEGWREMSSV